jgi:hypothetical protein
MGDSRNDMVLADKGEVPLRERIRVEEEALLRCVGRVEGMEKLGMRSQFR